MILWESVGYVDVLDTDVLSESFELSLVKHCEPRKARGLVGKTRDHLGPDDVLLGLRVLTVENKGHNPVLAI